MASIASTMLPPPNKPQEPGPAENNVEKSYDQTMNNHQTIPNDPQPQLPQESVSQQSILTPEQPAPQDSPHQAPRSSPGIPGQYPSTSDDRPPPCQCFNQMQPQPHLATAAGGTTEVVQKDRSNYVGGGGLGGGEFAMGMLACGVLGTAWGSRPYFRGGIGDGCEPVGSYSSSWNHHSTYVQGTNVTIDNCDDNDTTIGNNNPDVSNNDAAVQAQVAEANTVTADYDAGCDFFGGGGDYGGDFGGGDFGGGDFGAF